MKKLILILLTIGAVLVITVQPLSAAKGTRSAVGIKTDFGTTRYLDELYALKLGWTIAFIDRSGKCIFEKASWDEIDSEGPLFAFLLKEADMNNDNRVTRAEASNLLQTQKATLCRNAKRK